MQINSECKYKESERSDVEVKEPKRLKTGADEELAKAIYTYGPVAIAIHVTKNMALYKYYSIAFKYSFIFFRQ